MRLRPRGGVDGTSVSSVDATSVASTLRRGLRCSSGRSMGSTPQRQPVGLRPHLHPEVGFRSDRGLGPSTGLRRLRPVRSCWVDRGRYRHDPCGSLGSRAGRWRAGHPRASVRRMAVSGLTAICKTPGRAQPGGVVPDRVEEPREGGGSGQSSLGVLSCRMFREWPSCPRSVGSDGRIRLIGRIEIPPGPESGTLKTRGEVMAADRHGRGLQHSRQPQCHLGGPGGRDEEPDVSPHRFAVGGPQMSNRRTDPDPRWRCQWESPGNDPTSIRLVLVSMGAGGPVAGEGGSSSATGIVIKLPQPTVR